MRVDISGERPGMGDGWIRVHCDAPGCNAAVQGRPKLGEDWPPGWEQDLRRTPITTGSAKDYWPEHAGLPSA
jgi:hypothetical protein